MNQALIIYDGNGRVWSVQIGVTEEAGTLESFVAPVPEEFDSITIDVENKEAHFFLDGEEVFPEAGLFRTNGELTRQGGN